MDNDTSVGWPLLYIRQCMCNAHKLVGLLKRMYFHQYLFVCFIFLCYTSIELYYQQHVWEMCRAEKWLCNNPTSERLFIVFLFLFSINYIGKSLWILMKQVWVWSVRLEWQTDRTEVDTREIQRKTILCHTLCYDVDKESIHNGSPVMQLIGLGFCAQL